LVGLLAVACGLAGGCASDGRIPEGKKAIESFADTRAAVAKAQAQVDRVQASLRALSAEGGDLPKAYRNLNGEMSDLRKTADAAQKRAAAMRDRQEAFVQRWQQEMGDINDPTVEATLEQRRSAVRENYQRVRDAGQVARDAYGPYVDRVAQIQKALSIDLTPQTVAGIRPTIEQAHADGQTLKRALAELQQHLDRIHAGLSGRAAGK
jgi:chromosome segregation ATPase